MLKFLLFVFVVGGVYSEEEQKLLLTRQGVPPARLPLTRVTTPEWGTITQRVDHFNPLDNRTWTMRYLESSTHFQEGGPIFIFVGGEWAISQGWLTTGIMYDMAEIHHGYMFYTEHRYYGTSVPTVDLSTENLKYLSADQALADLVYFIEHKKQTVSSLQNSSVVIVGSSYAGSLATWGRLKYPHVIDIGYSSSGPLFAKADFVEYYEVVVENLGLASLTCPTIMQNAIVEINQLLQTPEGAANVSSMFNTCEVLNGTTEPQRSYFFTSISTPFASVTQYAQPGDLATLCTFLENLPGSDLEKLASYVRAVYGGCIATYDYFIVFYSDLTITGGMYRQWMYQTCTEYGWYQTNAFGESNRVEMYYQMCEDLFGETFNSGTLDTGIERTNLLYGGVEPELTRVITAHGTVDPWHPMGILEDINEYAPVIVVNGTSHCADLYSITDTDSEEMRNAKLRIMNTIATWLAELNGTTPTTSFPSTFEPTSAPPTFAPPTSAPTTVPVTVDDNSSANTLSIFVLLHICLLLTPYIF